MKPQRSPKVSKCTPIEGQTKSQWDGGRRIHTIATAKSPNPARSPQKGIWRDAHKK
jgi:hypothetical protein